MISWKTNKHIRLGICLTLNSDSQSKRLKREKILANMNLTRFLVESSLLFLLRQFLKIMKPSEWFNSPSGTLSWGNLERVTPLIWDLHVWRSWTLSRRPHPIGAPIFYRISINNLARCRTVLWNEIIKKQRYLEKMVHKVYKLFSCLHKQWFILTSRQVYSNDS